MAQAESREENPSNLSLDGSSTANEAPNFGEELLLEDPGGVAMHGLHAAFRRAQAGEGQARLLFYGASHVASDLFTHVIRQGLQARFGDAGHGFIMPARPWRRYRHLGLEVISSRRRWQASRIRASSREIDRLGLAGVSVEGELGGTYGRIQMGRNQANQLEFYFLKQPGGGSFDVRVDGERVRRVRTAADELEPGYLRIDTEDASHEIEVRLRGDGPVRFFGVTLERTDPGVVVDTLGINGARASSHLLWDDRLHREHLVRRNPDLVALAYGTNESGDVDQPIEFYERDLRQVLARIRSTVPRASCLLIGPSDRPLRQSEDHYVDRPRTGQILEAQRRIAHDFGCAFFDLVAFGGGPLSMVHWSAHSPAYAQRDLVHFTARGYRRLGEVLLGALLEGFDEDDSGSESGSTVTGP